MYVQCVKCGVVAEITGISLSGYSFQMKPGVSLNQLCPVILEQKKAKRETTSPDECPNLAEAIVSSIERFRSEQTAP